MLDEPLSNLDAGLRRRMRGTVTSILRRGGVTVVWVTRDQEKALSVGDRTAVLDAGHLQQVDTPRDVFMRPDSRMVAEFLGRTSYLPGRLVDGAVESPIGHLGRDRVAAVDHLEDDVDVLIRPDDVAIAPADPADADGRIVHRQYSGSTVRYRIALRSGDVLWSGHSHEEWYDLETPVSISITASHPLPAFAVRPWNGFSD